MAAAHSLDIRVGPSDDTALTLQEAGTLPRERQQLLIDLARALIEGQEAMDRQEAAGSPEQDHLTQDMHDLAAHKGHRNIGLYDLPDE